MNDFKIGNKLIGPNHNVFVIAEVGINHNGSVSLAKKMINAAKKANVDCIKFQTHITDKEMINTGITPGNISKKTLDRWVKILDIEWPNTKLITPKCYLEIYEKILGPDFDKSTNDSLVKGK